MNFEYLVRDLTNRCQWVYNEDALAYQKHFTLYLANDWGKNISMMMFLEIPDI